jgi:IS5 family transposase
MAGDLIRWNHATHYCMQHWYNLSDCSMEDALYEIASMTSVSRIKGDSALPVAPPS